MGRRNDSVPGMMLSSWPQRLWVFRALALVSGAGLIGCSNIQWQYEPNRAARKAAATNRPQFIYFRDWLSPDSTRMENQVLRRPEAAELLRDMVNVLLDIRIYEDVARRYGIHRAPAFIITKPNGQAVERYVGVPTLERFLSIVRLAKARVSSPAAGRSSSAVGRGQPRNLR